MTDEQLDKYLHISSECEHADEGCKWFAEATSMREMLLKIADHCVTIHGDKDFYIDIESIH